ncbi:cell division protein FtsQ [Glaciihabitans tibetensis]|uniref:Cell division protein FtsQ n=1 Tax=Glaciihabitans tibetensis TaxID=1266600 RepID=A0A2T0VEC3_9MICO|nr:FtsQ-type POTRA domain-containing protein [Glaciihabitans tibetensis]PRY68524.1 cell division protein FtsQ [Glaciihabitans tibetensis]
MKRPEGFDPHSAPEPDAPKARAPKNRGFRTSTPGPDTRLPGKASSDASPDAGAGSKPNPGTGRTAEPEHDRAESVASESPAAVRRRLRKAARARLRFERAEVRRFTRRSRRRRATWITVGAVVATLGVVLAIAVYSPILALREITIEGTSRVSEEDVRAAVEEQMGTPLALIDFDSIHSELAAFPLIRSYVTETVPPNTLRIQVVERAAIGSIERSGSFDEVDPAGVVISSSAERSGLPLIDVGDKGVDSAAFASAVEVLLAMPQEVADKVDVVTATTADDVQLALKETSARVVWGSARSSELKAQVLARMLQLPECASLAIVDVSAPLAPICSPQ